MTTQVRTVPSTPPPAPALPQPGSPVGILLAAVATALLRLPYLHAPLTSDEGGFLAVARGWHADGGSLYGAHWVDRPPLLLGLYKVAVLCGGLVPLRVIGALAAAATALLVGLAVRRVAGHLPGTAAATVAGALLASPLLGGVPANGELLAAPFVAGGVWAATLAIDAPVGRRLRRAALLAGACAAAALLVKQNMADVLVFAGVLVLVAHRQGRVSGAWLRTAATYAGGGLAACTCGVLGVAAMLGTDPGQVLWAMYPFRVRAASVMAGVSWIGRDARIVGLAEAFILSLGPVLLLGVAVLLVRRQLPARARPVAVAALGLAGYDVVSVVAGGSYWLHYLVELVVPVAVAAGLLLTVRRTWVRVVLVATLVVAAAGWSAGLHSTTGAAAQQVGISLAAVARPGDTIVSVLGEGGAVEASGLPSPYPYLWSLPARTLDPRLTRLDAVLEGPDTPTWVVVRGSSTWRYLDARATGDVLRARYHRVAVVCKRSVWLRDGEARSKPPAPASCRLPLVP